MKTLASMGEHALIRSLTRFMRSDGDVVVGIGDDCAVVRPRGKTPFDILLTSDPVIEGTHFTKSDPPAAVGHKAIGRVLSDIASMGGTPDWALIDLVAPPGTDAARIHAAYKGAARLASRFGLKIVGGDTSRGPVLEMHVFATGRVPRGTALLRSGAKPGDYIFATGMLGFSGKGKHLSFEPRLQEGTWLRESGMVTAMTDISDGLASDVRNLAAMSGCGASLHGLLISTCVDHEPGCTDAAIINHALYDGEDFELLFTVPATKCKSFIQLWGKTFKLQCMPVGVMTTRRGRIECKMPDGRITVISKRGFAHFEK